MAKTKSALPQTKIDHMKTQSIYNISAIIQLDEMLRPFPELRTNISYASCQRAIKTLQAVSPLFIRIEWSVSSNKGEILCCGNVFAELAGVCVPRSCELSEERFFPRQRPKQPQKRNQTAGARGGPFLPAPFGLIAVAFPMGYFMAAEACLPLCRRKAKWFIYD